MAKTTSFQRMRRNGQPYTMINVVPKFTKDEEGNFTGVETDELGRMVRVNQLTGFTFEDRFIEGTEEKPDGEWVATWEPHDLGQFGTVHDAQHDAEVWRNDLVGSYPVNP